MNGSVWILWRIIKNKSLIFRRFLQHLSARPKGLLGGRYPINVFSIFFRVIFMILIIKFLDTLSSSLLIRSYHQLPFSSLILLLLLPISCTLRHSKSPFCVWKSHWDMWLAVSEILWSSDRHRHSTEVFFFFSRLFLWLLFLNYYYYKYLMVFSLLFNIGLLWMSSSCRRAVKIW